MLGRTSANAPDVDLNQSFTKTAARIHSRREIRGKQEIFQTLSNSLFTDGKVELTYLTTIFRTV